MSFSDVAGDTAGGMGAAVDVQELRVRRGGTLVLPGLSLELPGGTVTGLLGPSGCGKTTLLRAIVGVQRVESGAVLVLGEPAGTLLQRRRVAYVTQTPSIYADLTGPKISSCAMR